MLVPSSKADLKLTTVGRDRDIKALIILACDDDMSIADIDLVACVALQPCEDCIAPMFQLSA